MAEFRPITYTDPIHTRRKQIKKNTKRRKSDYTGLGEKQ